jgi:hypothetical protein
MATITLEQWAAHLRSVDLGAAITQAGIKLALEGQRHAALGVTDAPGGLRVRSGNLRRSIKGVVKSVSGAKSVDIRLSAGGGVGRGLVNYAAIHEFGGTIQSRSGGSMTPSGVQREPDSGPARSVTIPPRPYLQPALWHIADKATEVMSLTIADAIRGDA